MATGSTPNREELFQMAVSTARTGNKSGAKMMFQQVLSQNPKDERALLWMAKIAGNATERRKWLERVLDVNPDNETAQRIISQMEHRTAADRNRAYLRIGVAGYVIAVTILAFVLIISSLSSAL